jgi:hypothetical protein
VLPTLHPTWVFLCLVAHSTPGGRGLSKWKGQVKGTTAVGRAWAKSFQAILFGVLLWVLQTIKLSLVELIVIVLLVPSPSTIQCWGEVDIGFFCFVLAPANLSFRPKTQKVVCGDCSSTERMLLWWLLPDGYFLFSVSRGLLKTAAMDLGPLLQTLCQESPACISFSSDSDRVFFVPFPLAD